MNGILVNCNVLICRECPQECPQSPQNLNAIQKADPANTCDIGFLWRAQQNLNPQPSGP